MQSTPETHFDEVLCCFQVDSILAGLPLPEGARDFQAFSAVLLPLVAFCGRVWFKSPWMVFAKEQCLCWCLDEQHAPELSVFRNIACLLCPHLLLTLCIWITPWAAISFFESSDSPSIARVGVASMVLQPFKSFASQC